MKANDLRKLKVIDQHCLFHIPCVCWQQFILKSVIQLGCYVASVYQTLLMRHLLWFFHAFCQDNLIYRNFDQVYYETGRKFVEARRVKQDIGLILGPHLYMVWYWNCEWLMIISITALDRFTRSVFI